MVQNLEFEPKKIVKMTINSKCNSTGFVLFWNLTSEIKFIFIKNKVNFEKALQLNEFKKLIYTYRKFLKTRLDTLNYSP